MGNNVPDEMAEWQVYHGCLWEELCLRGRPGLRFWLASRKASNFRSSTGVPGRPWLAKT